MARGLPERGLWWPGLPVLLLAVSCASVPDRSPEAGIDIPPQFASQTNAAPVPEEAWWMSFVDTNLNALVEEALQNNHNLQAAVARVDAAAAQARVAGADLYPSLGAGFDAGRSQRNFLGFPFANAGIGGGSSDEVLTTRTTSFALNLNVSWEVDLWGRLRSGRRAALTEVLASEADLAGVAQSLAAQTAKAWLGVIEARRLTDLAESTVRSYRSTSAEIRHRYRNGLRPALDLRLALANQAGAEALLAARRTAERRARQQLEILLGRYPAGQVFHAPAVDFPQMPATVPAGLPADLLARRPDLAAARQRLVAADWRVAQSKAALLPRLSLTASGGTSTEELADLLDPEFKVWNVAANLAQPILQGGRLRAGVDLSKAQTQQALAEYQSTVLRALGEVESALVAEADLARREEQLREAALQSAAALVLARQRYEFGLENFITVLEAQRRSLEADTQLVTVRRARLENRVDLHLALGGSFQSSAASLPDNDAPTSRAGLNSSNS